jgi:hypothetical protein
MVLRFNPPGLGQHFVDFALRNDNRSGRVGEDILTGDHAGASYVYRYVRLKGRYLAAPQRVAWPEQ